VDPERDGDGAAGPVRPRDQVAGLIRARIVNGDLKPGAVVPFAPELARETGAGLRTCQAALLALLGEGIITRVSPRSRPRVAGGGPPGCERELAQALAGLRRRAGLEQRELAGILGVSVTTVGHAETGRLWQARPFWEGADAGLDAGGALLARYDAWQSDRALEAGRALLARREEARAAAGEPAAPAEGEAPEAPAARGAPGGVVITLPCDPAPVTIRWGDGTVTTMRPGTG
jgi:DNA-binding XRE family transcriptional regulator